MRCARSDRRRRGSAVVVVWVRRSPRLLVVRGVQSRPAGRRRVRRRRARSCSGGRRGRAALRRPVSFAALIRSSTRAWRRWRSSRSGSWWPGPPGVVLVRNPVIRRPSASVIRSCAPGWGRSLRRINRVPGGQDDMSTHPVASATQGAVAELDLHAVLNAGFAGLLRRGPRRRWQHGEGGGDVEVTQRRPHRELDPRAGRGARRTPCSHRRRRCAPAPLPDRRHRAAQRVAGSAPAPRPAPRRHPPRCWSRLSRAVAAPLPVPHRHRCRGRRTRATDETRYVRFQRVASTLSECAVIKVASRSITTCTPWVGASAQCHTRSRAAARAVVIAASAASGSSARRVISRDTSGPRPPTRTHPAGRAALRHRRRRPRPTRSQWPGPARSCRDHDERPGDATAPTTASAPQPRCAAPFRPSTSHRHATPATRAGDHGQPGTTVFILHSRGASLDGLIVVSATPIQPPRAGTFAHSPPACRPQDQPARKPEARACPVDHGTGSRSQIVIEATSTVPRNM